MCLILVAWQVHPDYPLVVAANRDEFYQRPSAAAARWSEDPRVLAGRDLEAGGTWLGVRDDGRFAAVTNVREPAMAKGVRSDRYGTRASTVLTRDRQGVIQWEERRFGPGGLPLS
jgi:uncharacterized protein with NRDE domain